MAQKAHDELGGDAVLALGLLHSGSEAVDGDGEWQAAVGMELGIEEHLGVPAAIGVEPREIGEREILEILLGLEDVDALVADVEKVLEVGEGVGLADFLHRLERDDDLVPAAELEHLLGLDRALDVEVEFGFGQAADEAGKISHQGSLASSATSERSRTSSGRRNLPASWAMPRGGTLSAATMRSSGVS